MKTIWKHYEPVFEIRQIIERNLNSDGLVLSREDLKQVMYLLEDIDSHYLSWSSIFDTIYLGFENKIYIKRGSSDFIEKIKKLLDVFLKRKDINLSYKEYAERLPKYDRLEKKFYDEDGKEK